MKKGILAVALALLVLLAGCAPKEKTAEAAKTGAKQKLYVFNWTYYMDNSVIEDFKKEYNCDVIYEEYPTNEEMFAKITAGASGYDIVVPSGDFVSIMKNKGLLEKLDKSKLENFKNIDPQILDMITFDKGNEYSMPYFIGATAIIVNKKLVKAPYPRNFDIFLRDDLKGKMTLIDDMREVIGEALKHLGYSVNSTNPDELKKAKELVLKWKKNIIKFDAEAFGKSFATGEFAVVHGYQEVVMREIPESMRADVDVIIPDKGGTMYLDNMVILKDAKNKDLAYKFMNFIHRPENYAKIADFLMLPSFVNKEAKNFTKVKETYGVEDIKKCEFKEDIGEAVAEYDKIWQDIKVAQ